MRKISIGEWQEKRGRMLLKREELSLSRRSKIRQRDEKEREILFQMDRARKSRWQTEGRLVKVAPRRYSLKLQMTNNY